MPGEDLLLVMADISAELERRFNDWYSTEHLTRLTRMPGCLRGRRCRLIQPA